MEPLTFWTALALTSPFLWVAAIVIFGLITWAIEYERGFFAFLIFGVFAALVFWLGGHSLFVWVWENPWVFAKYIGGFVSIGVIWAVFYWIWPFCKYERLAQYEKYKRDWCAEHGLDPTKEIPPENRRAWMEYLYNLNTNSRDKERWADKKGYSEDVTFIAHVIPRAWEYKVDIARWIGWWPPHMFWWFCHGLVQGFWNWLVERLGGFLNRMAAWIFRRHAGDWDVPVAAKKVRPVVDPVPQAAVPPYQDRR